MLPWDDYRYKFVKQNVAPKIKEQKAIEMATLNDAGVASLTHGKPKIFNTESTDGFDNVLYYNACLA